MSTDEWSGTRCPRCPRPWPVESIRQQCLVEHGPVTDPAPEEESR